MAHTLESAVAAMQPKLPLAVGFSGGADSTALLTACAERWSGQTVAFHVHHGLQTAADGFESHCRAVCAELGVPLFVQQVDATHRHGESPEAAARVARYRAFEALSVMDGRSPPILSLALGHQSDDQVETLLIALSRGAGLPGLSAMPDRVTRGPMTLYRPLLAFSATDIRQWLRARERTWIEDPSNGDERFLRNRIRSELMPAIGRVFPSFRSTFARSAAHAAQAQDLLEDLAAIDLARCGTPPAINVLRELSAARRANTLRHWLRHTHQRVASAAQIDELCRQLRACTTRGHSIEMRVADGVVRRQAESLHWYNFAPPDAPGTKHLSY